MPNFTPQRGPRDAGAAHEAQLSRRAALELARIYVSASACASALETLDRLPERSWDEEARILRAEALLGLGRTSEAESLLGPVSLPGRPRPAETTQVTTWSESDEVSTGPSDGAEGGFSLRFGDRPRRPMSRRDRLSLQRFVIQLRILHRTGRYREVLQLGRQFFGGRPVPPSLLAGRIAMVVAQSMLAARQPGAARGLFEEVLGLYDRLRSSEGVADALLGLANTQLLDCHWDEADALYQESRFRYEEMGQSDKALACLVNLGVLRAKRGDFAGGKVLLEQARLRASQLGGRRREATIVLGLALVAVREGDPIAPEWILRALRLARTSRSLRSRGLALELMGEMYLHRGRLDRAARVLEWARRLGTGIAPRGDLEFEALRRLGEVAARRGDWAEVRVLSGRALEMARAYGDRYEAAAIDRTLGEADAATDQRRSAIGRLRSARDHLHRIGETWERARVEVRLIQLEAAEGLLAADRAVLRIAEVARPFVGAPASPLAREAAEAVREIRSLQGLRVR